MNTNSVNHADFIFSVTLNWPWGMVVVAIISLTIYMVVRKKKSK